MNLMTTSYNHVAIIMKAPPNAQRIKFHIPYTAHDWRSLVKSMNTSFYHSNQKLWSVINTRENLDELKKIFGNNYIIKDIDPKTNIPFIPLTISAKEALDAFIQKLTLMAYSQNTIRTYRNSFIRFLGHFGHTPLNELTKEEIEQFIASLISKYRISGIQQNQIINAIKFYYEKVLGRPKQYYDIQRPKKSKTLPNVLSEKEVATLINSPDNIKHKSILYTIYAAGLRLSELLNLRIEDIHSHDGYIFVKGGKGKKDRRTVLSERLLILLRRYYKIDKPAYWLFEGQ